MEKLWAQGREFEEDLIVVDTETGIGDIRSILPSADDAGLQATCLGRAEYARNAGFKSAKYLGCRVELTRRWCWR